MSHPRLFHNKKTDALTSPLHQYEIKTKVNLLEWPASDDRLPLVLGSLLTQGDLHANTIKLLYFLLKQNVIDMPRAAYERLVRIYYKHGFNKKLEKFPRYTNEEVLEFHHILQTHITLNPALQHAEKEGELPLVLRFIGDMFVDRCYADLLTMFVLMRLISLNVNFRILLSNHDLILLRIFEREIIELSVQPGLSASPLNLRAYYGSLCGLREMVEDGIVTIKEFKEMMETAFIPFILLADYTIHPISQKLTAVFTHARAGFAEIYSIARWRGGTILYKNPESMALIIDEMNEKFAWHKEDKSIYQYDGELSIYHNRTYSGGQNTPDVSPSTLFGHGHEGGCETNKTDYKNEVNLDDGLGRSLGDEAQLYHVLYEGPEPYVMKQVFDCLPYQEQIDARIDTCNKKINDTKKQLKPDNQYQLDEIYYQAKNLIIETIELTNEIDETKCEETHEAAIALKNRMIEAKDKLALSAYYLQTCVRKLETYDHQPFAPYLKEITIEACQDLILSNVFFLDNYVDAVMSKLENQLQPPRQAPTP